MVARQWLGQNRRYTGMSSTLPSDRFAVEEWDDVAN